MSSSNDFFKALFKTGPHPYLILKADDKFTIVAVNDYYLNVTGIAEQDVIGKALFEVFPDNPSDETVSGVSDLHISLDRVVKYGKTDIMGVQKYDILLRDGSGKFEVKYWSPVNAPVFDENKNVTHIIHNVEDVTDFVLLKQTDANKRSEAEIIQRANEVKNINRQLKAREDELVKINDKLRRSEERLKRKREFINSILDISAALIVALDANGKIVHFNKTCEKLTGYAREEVIGTTLWEKIIPKEQVKGVMGVFANLCAKDFPNSYENHWISKRGKAILIRWSNTAILDNNEKIEFIIGTGIDITAIKENELKLQLAASVLENISEGVITTTKDGEITYVNPAFTNISGFDVSEVLRKTPRVIKSNRHDQVFYERLWQTISSGEIWCDEIWNRKKSGEVFLSKETITPIKNDQDEITNYVAVFTDVTKDKEQQL